MRFIGLYVAVIIFVYCNSISAKCINEQYVNTLNTMVGQNEVLWASLAAAGQIPLVGIPFAVSSFVHSSFMSKNFYEQFKCIRQSINPAVDYDGTCTEIMNKVIFDAEIIKGGAVAIGAASFFPGTGIPLLLPKITTSALAAGTIKLYLERFVNAGCVNKVYENCNCIQNLTEFYENSYQSYQHQIDEAIAYAHGH